MNIGSKIKSLRLNQHITLKELARKTKLTASFISQLERGKTASSVNSLKKIAKALFTNISYFFEDERSKGIVFIKKAGGKTPLDKAKKVFCQRLTSESFHPNSQPRFFTLGKGAQAKIENIPFVQERLVVMLRGKTDLICRTEELTLEEGDSICFNSEKKFTKVINVGNDQAKLLCIGFTLS